MPNIASLSSLYLILAFLVPGLITMFVRAQFITGRGPTHAEAALSYLILSIIYYALTLPFVDYVLSLQEAGYHKALCWFALVFIGPAVFGLLLGLNTKFEWLRGLLKRWGINSVHAMPTAWDWKFGNAQESWVLVVLKDGTKFAGYCGVNSFMSSDPKERDLYIQQVFDVGDDNKWQRRESSVLICAGEIRTVEFWPVKKSN